VYLWWEKASTPIHEGPSIGTKVKGKHKQGHNEPKSYLFLGKKVSCKDTSVLINICNTVISHVRWVPSHHGVARPRVPDGGESLQILKVAAKTLNRQYPSPPPTSELAVGLTTPHLKNLARTKRFKTPQTWNDSLARNKQWR
jgi:hypothetical protein